MVRKSRLLTPLLWLLITAPAVFSESGLTIEMGLNNIFVQTREAEDQISTAGGSPVVTGYEAGDKYWGWMTSGSAGLSFKSEGSRNVKADFALNYILPGQTVSAGGASIETPLLMLERAYVKARFPWFRLTAGKTRLSWGDGFVFNSGDVLFGSTGTSIDLTAAEIRTETDWITAVNIPLGRFSFIEGVIMPPQLDSGTELFAGSLDRISGGGRLYTKLAGVKLEGGYFFDQSGVDVDDADSYLHKPYISFQGNFFADWYLSSSAAIPYTEELQHYLEDSLIISGGIFYLHRINSISSISFRTEALYRPFKLFEEQERLAGDDNPTYGLMLYPEISYSPTDTVSLSVRSIWSPVDMSAMISFGTAWNVFEGFDLSCYGIINTGEADDYFAFNRSGELWKPSSDLIDSAAFVLGINYIY